VGLIYWIPPLVSVALTGFYVFTTSSRLLFKTAVVGLCAVANWLQFFYGGLTPWATGLTMNSLLGVFLAVRLKVPGATRL